VPDDDAGAEVHFAATVAAVEGSLITFTVEAVCADQKVLGAARAVVDLDA
jgi:predicted thioesterase